jgi:imidazoleglycerol-phosphate dehydratase / histidinol-phosphatase
MKKRVLFIDRDGTLIVEPEPDKQVDSLEKLSFIPGVFTALSRIVKFLEYDLVMVTNQDGLGTESFPEENFWPAHNKMLEALKGEGIVFSEVLIDRSFPEEKSPDRKPETGLVAKYINNPEYDLENSFVIGDRMTDVEFAANMGAKALHFVPRGEEGESVFPRELCTDNWDEMYRFLRGYERRAVCERRTKETSITVKLSLDGCGLSRISTGLGFFDHMLEQIAKHSGCDLELTAEGDLHVDEHHTIEDTGILLGEAVLKALGNKIGIERYSFLLPMDESLAQVALDFSGRAGFQWDADFKREKIGDMPTEMFSHFFKSFCYSAKCTLHISARGTNEHHKIEGIFKAFAKCLSRAWRLDFENDQLPSTKGLL